MRTRTDYELNAMELLHPREKKRPISILPGPRRKAVGLEQRMEAGDQDSREKKGEKAPLPIIVVEGKLSAMTPPRRLVDQRKKKANATPCERRATLVMTAGVGKKKKRGKREGGSARPYQRPRKGDGCSACEADVGTGEGK